MPAKFAVNFCKHFGASSILRPKNLGVFLTLATPLFEKFNESCWYCPWEHACEIWSP